MPIMFPVEDITHHFSRPQSKVEEETRLERGVDTPNDETVIETKGTMTLEEAIAYFYSSGNKSISEQASKQLSSWLEELRHLRGGKIK